VVGDFALEMLVRLPSEEREKATAEMKALGGEAAWGVVAAFPDADLHLLPARFVEQLLPRALALLNALIAATPVEQLEGVGVTSGQLADDRPLSLLEQRAIWQLGLS
jgi:hypothetical protein